MPSAIVHRFAKVLTAGTLVLIAAGGLVTSTGSGLAVPDWPLSYGTLFPPMIGGIRFEHSHRVIAGTIGLLTVAFAIVVFRRERRAWVRNLAFGAVGAVVLQAVLGGLTVRYLLPLPVSVAHACLGQTFFCLIAALAYVSSSEWTGGRKLAETPETAVLKRLAAATLGIAYIQLILGAVVRHTHGHGISVHYMGAFLIIVHLFLMYSRIQRAEPLRMAFSKHAAALFLISIVQIALGFGSFVYRLVLDQKIVRPATQVLFTTAHQTTGALLLALILVLTLRVYRLNRSGA